MYNNDPKYMNPQQGLASLVNSPYGDSDVMQVKMTPNEVAGLQHLARSYGAQEQDLYDPITGQPKFSFLKKILPMIAGAILPGIPGVGAVAKTLGFGNQALGSALLVGGVTGLIEGDLKKGLMAGLGAYSGAKIGEAFTAAGRAMPAPEAPAAAPAPTASINRFADDFNVSPEIRELYTPPPSPVATTPPTQAADIVQTVTQRQAPTGFMDTMGTMGQGVKNVFASGPAGDASRRAFGDVFSNPFVRSATLMGGLAAITPEQKPFNVPEQEDIMYIPGGFNPLYGTGANQPPQLPGRYYKRTKQGLVPYNPYQMAPGYADGGEVNTEAPEWLKNSLIIDPADSYSSGVTTQQTTPQQTTPQQTASNQQPTANSIVEANRAYVEQLNRRATKPEFTPYGMVAYGGLGGTNNPWTGTNPYGGPLTPPATGGQTTGGDSAAQTAAFLATQVGINWMMQPGNAVALKNWITGGMKWADRPFLNADKAATGTGTGAGTETGGQQTQTGGQQTQTGGQQTQTQTSTGTGTGTAATTGADTSTFDPNVDYSKYTNVGGDLSKLSSLMKARGGLESLGTLGGLSSTGFGGINPTTLADAAKATTLSGGMAPSGSIASQYGGMKGALQAGADTGAAQSGLSTLQNKIIPGIGTALGVYNTAKAIEAGKEGRAAFSAASAAASAAKLGAPLGPAGMLAAAAIAAIGASLVNTKEQGDVALRNYWKAVDQGRGLGSAPPEELAEGFINFYRTNKNQFAGQDKYGRKGNEDFVYDMTQVINKGVESGAVSKDAKPEEIYQKVVQPWLNSMGEGPKDADARRIQDFMMTDLIYNFMLGRPISNAQVKNDKKFKIVSQKPVYAGNPPPLLGQLEQAKTQALGQGVDGRKLAEYLQAQNPYGQTMPFAEGGAIGDDYNFGFAGGGMPEYQAGGTLLNGPGDGMSDSIPAVIRGKGVQRAALADGEFVIPADVVSHLGNGSTKAGASKLYDMMDKVRQARTGKTRQAPAVNPNRLLPA